MLIEIMKPTINVQVSLFAKSIVDAKYDKFQNELLSSLSIGDITPVVNYHALYEAYNLVILMQVRVKM